jgi:hypothetical protein
VNGVYGVALRCGSNGTAAVSAAVSAAARGHRWRASRHRELSLARATGIKCKNISGGGSRRQGRDALDACVRGSGVYLLLTWHACILLLTWHACILLLDALDARTRARWLDVSEQEKWMVARRRLSSADGQEAKESGGGGKRRRRLSTMSSSLRSHSVLRALSLQGTCGQRGK